MPEQDPGFLSFWLNAERQIQRERLLDHHAEPPLTAASIMHRRRCAVRAWIFANPTRIGGKR